MNKNGRSRKNFLEPGKRKQQKKLLGTWETEPAGKASWDLRKESSRKNFLGPGNGSSRKSFLRPGKRKQQKSFLGPGKRNQHKKLPETTDWVKRKLDKLLMRKLARRQLFYFIYNF
jgi:hypothetical protein